MIIAAQKRESRIVAVLADERYPIILWQEFSASQVSDAATKYVSFAQADLGRELSGDGSLSRRPWKWIVMSAEGDVFIWAAEGQEHCPWQQGERQAYPKSLRHAPIPPSNG